ncbi:MAG: DUF1501 domain-containing protein, partial [Planctomycetaceae bacterium]|nr:DUF1501 domain-containing protein [Planctomycetaceae bacterium]
MNHESLSRRELLHRSGMGFGALGLAGLIGQADGAAQAFGATSPMAAKTSQFLPKAKHVIHVFCNGGPSHVDTFDPKPVLEKFAGKKLPMDNLKTERPTGAALPSPFKFRKYGESGIEVSELFSHVAECIDDIAVIRSMNN